MYHRLSVALCLMLLLILPCRAAKPEASVCFSQLTEDMTGIYLEALPEQEEGLLTLGDRILRAGDVLTARQAQQMTFHPVIREDSRVLEVSYLPIFPHCVAARQTWILSIGGSRDEAPIAEDSAGETYKNISASDRLRVRDPEGEPLTFTLVRPPRRGTVELHGDGTYTYTPKKNKVGIDSFSYTAADPAGNLSRQATVTVTILKPSDAARYVDTFGRTCEFSAQWLRETGILSGTVLGNAAQFDPDRTVSRGEFLTMLLSALDISPEEELAAGPELESLPFWLRPYAAAAVRSGLTAGLPKLPDWSAGISGEEAAVLIQNALDLPVPVLCREDLPAWAAPSVAALTQAGISLPEGPVLTRSDAAQLLYRLHCRADA